MGILSKLSNEISVNHNFLYTFGGLSNVIKWIVRDDLEKCKES